MEGGRERELLVPRNSGLIALRDYFAGFRIDLETCPIPCTLTPMALSLRRVQGILSLRRSPLPLFLLYPLAVSPFRSHSPFAFFVRSSLAAFVSAKYGESRLSSLFPFGRVFLS